MDTIFKKEPKKRQERIRKLKFYMENPGYFPILLLGERGVGKTFWIENLIEEKQLQGAFMFINAFLAEETEEYWDKLFKKTNNGCLIIEEAERLSKKNQELLFQSMMTNNGKYGFKDKKYLIRLIFTTSYDISALKNTEEYLSHKFFDRISQLVVRFLSFKDFSANIKQDFIYTWEKFKFEDKHKIPQGDIIKWLELNADTKLQGNFRDLDKICINWHNYRLMGYKEDDIYKQVIDNFQQYLKYPKHKTEQHNEFIFSNDLKHDDIMKAFRQQYKKWAKQEFGTLKVAGEKLGISHRTMERW